MASRISLIRIVRKNRLNNRLSDRLADGLAVMMSEMKKRVGIDQ